MPSTWQQKPIKNMILIANLADRKNPLYVDIDEDFHRVSNLQGRWRLIFQILFRIRQEAFHFCSKLEKI